MRPISQALGTKLDFMAVSHLGYKADPSEKQEEVLPRAWLGTSLFVHPCREVQRGPCCLNFQEEKKILTRLVARSQSNKFRLIIM